MTGPQNEDSAMSAVDYSKALRVIGCALEELGVEDFELTHEGVTHVVRIHSQKRKKQPRTRLRLLQKILPYSHSSARPSAARELIYTPGDIERFERNGQLKRQNAGNPDPHSLPQALRAIGAYLDSKDARLLQLSRQGTLTSICYETAPDGRQTERFTPSSLYSLFVRRYVKRSDRRKALNAPATEIQTTPRGSVTIGLPKESWPEDERGF
jgi:hypothetical protein